MAGRRKENLAGARRVRPSHWINEALSTPENVARGASVRVTVLIVVARRADAGAPPIDRARF
jgi:hypothetical protein